MSERAREFIDIEEVDTPFYHYTHQNTSKNIRLGESVSQIYANQTPECIPNTTNYLDENAKYPVSLSQSDIISQKPRHSKNSIFDLDHKISKPTSQMTSAELHSFCIGLERSLYSVKENSNHSESVMVPVILPQRPITPLLRDKSIDDIAFLGISTSATNLFHQEKVPGYSSKPVYLSVLQTQKNFLGRGQYSKVYLGSFSQEGSNTKYPCAVKIIERCPEAQYLAMVESTILINLSHPSIISLIHLEDENGMDSVELHDCIQKSLQTQSHSPLISVRLMLVLEYCCSGNLWSWIENHSKSVSKKLWLKWAKQIANGVEYIHSMGIIHHDIKPHNILVAQINQVTSMLDIKICDFGNASFVPEIEQSRRENNLNIIIPGTPTYSSSQDLIGGAGKGTPSYSAPEVFSINKPYSFPIDIYSVGVVMYTIISQQNPFANCTSTVQMMLSIKRGFFALENQVLVRNWRNPDPSDFQWQFGNSETVPSKLTSIVTSLLSCDSSSRPTAIQLSKMLRQYDD